MKKSRILLIVMVVGSHLYGSSLKNHRYNDQNQILSFDDAAYGVIFNGNGEPIRYEDGAELQYDDKNNVIIYNQENDEPMGYIAINSEDGEYEFFDYSVPTGIAGQAGALISGAASGYQKTGKKIGKYVWSWVVWPKKEKTLSKVPSVSIVQSKKGTPKNILTTQMTNEDVSDEDISEHTETLKITVPIITYKSRRVVDDE